MPMNIKEQDEFLMKEITDSEFESTLSKVKSTHSFHIGGTKADVEHDLAVHMINLKRAQKVIEECRAIINLKVSSDWIKS